MNRTRDRRGALLARCHGLARAAAPVLMLAASAAQVGAATVSPIRTVASVTQPAPGGTRSFGTFISSPPSVNVHGDVAFRAAYAHQGPEGIWAERGAAGLKVVAVNGQAAPGVSGRAFDYFADSNPGTNAAVSSLPFNNAGQIAFRATLTGGGTFNSDGLWLAQPNGVLELIGRSGGVLPGGSRSVVQLQHDNVALNQAGVVTLRGRYTTSFTNNAGVWSYDSPGPIRFVGETFDPVPGEPNQFAEFAFDGALADAAGRVYLKASPGTATGGYTGDSGIYVLESGRLRTLARDDQAIPGGAGLRFNNLYPFDLTINSTGQYAFASGIAGGGVTTSNDVAVFRGHVDGGIETVLREGQPAPGLAAGLELASFSSPEINASGRLAMVATIRGPGVNALNDEVVFVESPTGQFLTLVREGDQAPEAPANVFFGRGTAGGQTFADLAFNARGQVAFHPVLSGPGLGLPTGRTADGIWATDVHGALRSIVIATQPYAVAEGTMRTDSFVIFAGDTGNDEGLASGLSDNGHVAYHGVGGSSLPGILVSAKVAWVPEPDFAAMLFAAVAAGLKRRMRSPAR